MIVPGGAGAIDAAAPGEAAGLAAPLVPVEAAGLAVALALAAFTAPLPDGLPAAEGLALVGAGLLAGAPEPPQAARPTVQPNPKARRTKVRLEISADDFCNTFHLL